METTRLRTQVDTPDPVPSDDALPPGFRIDEFVIDRTIGRGGFSIVYAATDTGYLGSGRRVALKEYFPGAMGARDADFNVLPVPGQRNAFDIGLRSFINEAQLLASFDHASLVKVFKSGMHHDTAYLVMPYYDEPTLETVLNNAPSPSEAWLKAMLAPLLDALDTLHAGNCLHRDISVDNILLLGSEHKPLLLDLGSARRATVNGRMTRFVKEGYTPPEQCGVHEDGQEAAQGPWTDVYSLCAVLYAAITKTVPPSAQVRFAKDDMVPAAVAARGRYSRPFLAAIDRGLSVNAKDRPQTIAALREMLFAEGARTRTATIWSLALVCVALAGGALLWSWPRNEPRQSPPPPDQFSAVAVLEDVARRGDRAIPVEAAATPPRVTIGRDHLQFKIKSPVNGYLYVILAGTDDRVVMLYPDARDTTNRITADEPVVLPLRASELEAAGPPGVDHVLFIVSRMPRDFGRAGIRPAGVAQEFDLAKLRDLWPTRDEGNATVYGGVPKCTDVLNCDPAYGAALITVLEAAP